MKGAENVAVGVMVGVGVSVGVDVGVFVLVGDGVMVGVGVSVANRFETGLFGLDQMDMACLSMIRT